MHDPHYWREFERQYAENEFRRDEEKVEREHIAALIDLLPGPLPVAEWLAERAKKS